MGNLLKMIKPLSHSKNLEEHSNNFNLDFYFNFNSSPQIVGFHWLLSISVYQHFQLEYFIGEDA